MVNCCLHDSSSAVFICSNKDNQFLPPLSEWMDILRRNQMRCEEVKEKKRFFFWLMAFHTLIYEIIMGSSKAVKKETRHLNV